MLERIRRCAFCAKEMNCSALSYEENPFCTDCLSLRLDAAAKANALLTWMPRGDYMQLTDLGQQKPQ